MAAKKKTPPRAKTGAKPKKPTAIPRPAPDVVVKVDADLKRRWDALLQVIDDASQKEKLDFDRRWEAAGEIVDHDPPLYVVGGYENAAEFYREYMKEEPRTARRYVRVAKFASPREEERYGLQRLDAALGFIEAKIGKSLEHPPLPVAFDKLRVPVGDGTKLVADATVAEITAATRKLTSASRKKPASAARSAVEKALAAIASLANVRVHERNGIVSFEGVPLAALAKFGRAVAGVKLPS